MDNRQIKELRELLEQATELQKTANQIVAEVTDQLQRSIFLHDEHRPVTYRDRHRGKRADG